MRVNIIILFVLFFYNNAITQCGNLDASIWNDTWQSCQTSENPNPARGNGHWIQYDFGGIYTLSKAHVWNTNEVGKTQNGFRNVTVDYSEDGVTWEELGSYEFPQGTEAAIYGGFEGFDFEGKKAQYVIITATSNWGGNCYGLAEVKFNLLLDFEGIEDPGGGGGEECESVEDVTILEVGDHYAWVAWEEVEGAEGYIVAYTIVDEDDWQEVIVDNPEAYLEDLDDETEYEFVIIVICEDEEESEESELFSFTTLEEGATSVSDLEKTEISKFHAVPNPASTNVRLLFESQIQGAGFLEIRNVNGSQINTQQLNFMLGKNNHQLSVEELASGVYFLTLRHQEAQFTERLVVIKD